MENDRGLRVTSEVGAEKLGRKVHILIGSDSNTLLVNGQRVRLSTGRKKVGVIPSQQDVDAIFLLQHLQQNQGRMINSSDLIHTFTDRVRDTEPDVVARHPEAAALNKALSVRVRLASNALQNRLRVDGRPLLSVSQEKAGRIEVGIMNFDVTTQRTLSNLSGYPYEYHQRDHVVTPF